jgi:cytochrome c-type biogenesis protein CcmH/NrfG
MLMKCIARGVVATLILCSGAAIAAGGGGDGGDAAQVVSADPEFNQGVAAVEAKNWPQVIARMGSVVARDPKNADAWNYMGYAYRQMGEMDKSFKNYEMALQLNPKHRGAHEYLGEAFLMVGKLAQAEEQLKALDKLCFLPCEEYSDLKEHIAKYKLEHQATASR